MPIYEYWCGKCRRKFEVLIRRMEDREQPPCPGCQGTEVRRLVSRVARVKSDEARLASLADPANLSGLDENDPAGMARWVKKMGRELGDEVSRDEIDRVADDIGSGKGLDAPPEDFGDLD